MQRRNVLAISTSLRRRFDVSRSTDCTSRSPEFPDAFIAESQARMNFVTAAVVALYEVLTKVQSVIPEN